MPTVRIKGWPRRGAPSVPPPGLTALLSDDVDMDAEQVEETFRRLKKGKSVDLPFDPGDEAPARRMMKKLELLGLESELRDEEAEDPDRAGERGWRFRGALYIALFLIGAIARSPWLGVLLVAIGLGAVGCAALIRKMTARAERRFEVLRSFDPDDKVH